LRQRLQRRQYVTQSYWAGSPPIARTSPSALSSCTQLDGRSSAWAPWLRGRTGRPRVLPWRIRRLSAYPIVRSRPPSQGCL